jgi:REP element-mobilizing transposase RayT
LGKSPFTTVTDKHKEQVVVLELNVQPDLVHLVVEIPPKYAVSEFMGYLKGILAIRLYQQYESLAKRYWGRHLWARGYCVSTVGLDEEKIRKYVQWQERQERQAEAVQGKLFEQFDVLLHCYTIKDDLKVLWFSAYCPPAVLQTLGFISYTTRPGGGMGLTHNCSCATISHQYLRTDST